MGSIEVALYALVIAAPLAIGSVHASTQVLLALGAFVLLLACAVGPLRDKGVRIPPFAWIPIAALTWTAAQLIPLPLGLLRSLSPHAALLRDEVGARVAPLTLDAPATMLELCKALAAICILLVGAEAARKSGRRVATLLAYLGALVVVLLWVHRLGGASRIYGIYTPHSLPGGGVFAPFVSGNHAASLLALCALCAAGVAFGREDGRGPFYGAVAFACGATVLATMSRGGAIGLAAGALLLVAVLASARYGRLRALVLSGTIILTLGAGALLIADGLRSRFAQTSTHTTLTDNQKTRGWLVALKLADAFPLTGVGRGSFEAPGAAMRTDDEGVRLVYPENVVMQAVSEWGWPFGLALLGALVAGFVMTLRRCRIDPAHIGLAAGVLAVGVHELFDFGLEFPGVLLPTTLAMSALVACAESNDRTRSKPRPRITASKLAPVLVIGSAIIVGGLVARAHTLDADLTSPNIEAAIRRHPASAELEVRAAEEALKSNDASALHHLNRAMRLQPSAAMPHVLAAVELERLHRYGQAALEYRLANERGYSISNVVLAHHLGRYALDAVSKRPDAYLALGTIFAQLKRWDDAQLAYQRAAELDPSAAPRQALLGWSPPERQPAVLEEMARNATDDTELARAVDGWAMLKQFDRAEQVLSAAVLRFPTSAPLAVSGARMRAQHGDLDGARKLIGRTARFDLQGRVLAEEALIALARQGGDLDQVAAGEARLHLLRAKAHIDEPAGGGTP